MKPVFVRPATPADSVEFTNWSINGDRNGFDPDVPKYGTTVTWTAYTSDGQLAFLPMQTPIMLESLAVKPGATHLEVATALKEFVTAAITQCHIRGVGELWFVGTNPETNRFAEGSGIFEKVEFPVYRLKVSNLEKKG